MFKLSDGGKGVIGNVKRDADVPNVPYLSLLHDQQKQLVENGGLQSEYSPSPSSFSNGFSSPEDGSPFSAPFDVDVKYQTRSAHYLNYELWLDSGKSPESININERKFIDGVSLSKELYRMSIGDEPKGDGCFEMDPNGFGVGDGPLGDNKPYNAAKYVSFNSFNNDISRCGGFQSSSHGVPIRLDDDIDTALLGMQGGGYKTSDSMMGAYLDYNQFNGLPSSGGLYANQSNNLLGQRKEQGRSCRSEGFQLENPASIRPYLNDALIRAEQYKVDSYGGRSVINSLDASQLMQPKTPLSVDVPLCNRSMLKENAKAIVKDLNTWVVPQSLRSYEDSLIIQGKSFNPSRGHKKNSHNEIVHNLRERSNEQLSPTQYGRTCENDQSFSSFFPFLLQAPSSASLAEAQGYIYLMAQDQNGCRFLQRVFDEGTYQDVQLIFNDIIDHVVDLMMKQFGNYLVQKLLDVCNEQQRLQIVLMMTKEQGELVRISLNTYGTRVVQKLIETLKTRQQISLVILALKPGFLDLVKDQNGNHVLQRCLQCLSKEDNKGLLTTTDSELRVVLVSGDYLLQFIFDAAIKFCVDIATHRHGCCVLQRCIAHSTGKGRDKLVNEISMNGLLLAQDPFGNYVVQYIIELKSPSATANLISQFRGQYVHLSLQKSSSHVVEKCLKHFGETRSEIIHELLSVYHFEQLLQDPYANYVIQAALTVTKGPLHASLVEAIQPYSVLRTSPYCKRIFSRNLLKK